MDMVDQFDIYLVDLDPTVGSEIKKIRPCVVISPNQMNKHLNTVLVAPMTSALKNYPFRVRSSFQGKEGDIILDQIRTVSKLRFIKKMGTLDKAKSYLVLSLLQEMFS